MEEAIAAVNNGLSLVRASDASGIPETTLRRYVTRRRKGIPVMTPGRRTRISALDEAAISAYVGWAEDNELSIRSATAKVIAARIAEAQGVPYNTPNGLPSESVMRRWRKEYDLELKKTKRSKVNPPTRGLWKATCAAIQGALDEHPLLGAGDIYNFDEVRANTSLAKRRHSTPTGGPGGVYGCVV